MDNRGVAAATAAIVLASTGVAVAAHSATARTVQLGNGVVTRTWSIGPDGTVTTTSLRGDDGTNWVIPGVDFSVTVGDVVTSPGTGWTLAEVEPNQSAVEFRYVLGAVGLPSLELDRRVVLRPGSSVFETTSTLVSLGAPARIPAYTLDQVTAADPAMPAEVQAYNGGSDWRDDYRHVSKPAGAFDAEGEVVRFGTDAGLLLV
jgi:hypothetical protein